MMIGTAAEVPSTSVVSTGVVQAGAVRAGATKAGAVRAGATKAGAVRAGATKAGAVRAGDQPRRQWVFHAPELLDVRSAAEVRRRLHELVTAAGPAVVVVDFSALERIDVVGLGVVMGAYRKCAGQGGTLRVLGARPRVAAVLAATRLDRLLCGVEPDARLARWHRSRF